MNALTADTVVCLNLKSSVSHAGSFLGIRRSMTLMRVGPEKRAGRTVYSTLLCCPCECYAECISSISLTGILIGLQFFCPPPSWRGMTHQKISCILTVKIESKDITSRAHSLLLKHIM